jgi:hypothetical protein
MIVVQGKNTFLSSKNFYLIKQLLLQREIFFSNVFNNKRSTILLRLQFIKYIIFSFYIFLENTKYLESCVKIMKFILLLSFKDFISDDFTH